MPEHDRIRREHGRRSPIRGWAEVALRVRDLEQMLTFYRDVVGLDVARQDENMAFLVVPGTDEPQSLALFDGSIAADVPSINFSSIEPDKGSLHHFAFAIPREAHDAERDRLEALGLAVRIQHHAWANASSLFFSDPEGNVVEFVSYG